MSTPFIPPPSPPAARKMSRGVDDSTGVNSTKVVTVHGARYKLRQPEGPAAASEGQEQTDAARLARSGTGIMCLDMVAIPVDVYIDALGTAETLFFIAGGACFDEAMTAQLFYALCGSPDLSKILSGEPGAQIGPAKQRLAQAIDKARATLSGLPPPDQSLVHRWPTLFTHHKVGAFGQLAGLGALHGAAINTRYDAEASTAPLTATLTCQLTLWVDPSAGTEDHTLHRNRVTDLPAGTPGAPLTTFPGIKGDKATARDGAVAESTFAFEAALDPMFDPAPLPDAVEGSFDTWRTLVRDMVPGTQNEVIHGAFVQQSGLSSALDAAKARFEALLDQLFEALDPDAFADAMSIRFPYHYKRLGLDDVTAAGRAERLRV